MRTGYYHDCKSATELWFKSANFCLEDSSENESDQGPVSDSEDEENEGGQERQAHTTSETEVEVLTPATTPVRVMRAQLRSQLDLPEKTRERRTRTGKHSDIFYYRRTG